MLGLCARRRPFRASCASVPALAAATFSIEWLGPRELGRKWGSSASGVGKVRPEGEPTLLHRQHRQHQQQPEEGGTSSPHAVQPGGEIPGEQQQRPAHGQDAAGRDPRGPEQREGPPEQAPRGVARSLAEALRDPTQVRELRLSRSADLVCHNLMCEKVLGPCVCRLTAALGRMPRLRVLDISHNSLASLPDTLGSLPELTHLDISGNPVEEVPESLLQKPGLKITT